MVKSNGYGGVTAFARFVGFALDGGEWPVSHSDLITSEGMVPGTNWVGGRMDSRAGPGGLGE